MDDKEIKNRIVEKMLRGSDPVIGGHKIRVDTAVKNYLPTHQRGRGKTLIDEMLKDPSSPIEGYGGGGRKNIRLVSAEAAVEFLKENDGNVPFGYD